MAVAGNLFGRALAVSAWIAARKDRDSWPPPTEISRETPTFA